MALDSKDIVKLSKRLSLILRHHPEYINIELDAAGWVDVDILIQKMDITRDDLNVVVTDNNKSRFAFNETGDRIRANQGHSIDVDLGLTPQIPPEYLYHGTFVGVVDEINLHGIKKQGRHAVHLSTDIKTAKSVGSRHGKPMLFVVHTESMYEAGHLFYQSENGVWLTDIIPPQYIKMRTFSQLSFNDITEDMHVTDNYGRLGIITEIDTIHNVCVDFGNGDSGIYCMDTGCTNTGCGSIPDESNELFRCYYNSIDIM